MALVHTIGWRQFARDGLLGIKITSWTVHSIDDLPGCASKRRLTFLLAVIALHLVQTGSLPVG